MLTVVGKDDFLLNLLREGGNRTADRRLSRLDAGPDQGPRHQSINPGGAVAFADNARTFDLDDVVPFYGVTSRQIIEALQQARDGHRHRPSAASPHQQSRHRRQCRDGDAHDRRPRNGKPLHLAHLQFYAYGKDGKRGFSSGAAQLADAVNDDAQCHGRCRPGHVPADGDDFLRRGAPVQLDRHRQAAANR